MTFNGRHSTPMGIAAFFDFVDVLVFEQKQGKGLDVADTIGLTPLMLAAHGGSPNAVRFLLGYGADPRKSSLFGCGVARYASRNAVSVIAHLLEAGASISLCTRDDGQNPVQAACSSAGLHPSVLPGILKYASVDDLNVKNFMGQNALHIAAGLDIRASVELFMERLSSTDGEISGPQRLRTTVEEAFTPVTRSAIKTWATSWGYVLPDVFGGESSRAELKSFLQLLSDTSKLPSSIISGEKGHL
jgi:ankyrin repeat protein